MDPSGVCQQTSLRGIKPYNSALVNVPGRKWLEKPYNTLAKELLRCYFFKPLQTIFYEPKILNFQTCGLLSFKTRWSSLPPYLLILKKCVLLLIFSQIEEKKRQHGLILLTFGTQSSRDNSTICTEYYIFSFFLFFLILLWLLKKLRIFLFFYEFWCALICIWMKIYLYI